MKPLFNLFSCFVVFVTGQYIQAKTIDLPPLVSTPLEKMTVLVLQTDDELKASS